MLFSKISYHIFYPMSVATATFSKKGKIEIPGEMLPTNVVENIVDTCQHLPLRHDKGKFRIHNCKLRRQLIPKYMTDFQLLIMIGNNCAAVNQLNGFPIFRKFLAQMLQGIFPKIKFCRI